MGACKTGQPLGIRIFSIALLSLAFAACRPPAAEDTVSVAIVADGTEQTFRFDTRITVEELLASANIVLGEQDRVSHPLSLQIAEGMRVTIRRVREEQVCLQEMVPFARRYVAYEGIATGNEQLGRAGKDGMQEICYRSILENDIETKRIPVGQSIVLSEPQDEIVYVGPAEMVESREIPGRLSYINNRTAWTIKGKTDHKRPLPKSGGLDSLVFAQSTDGTHLIYTRETDSSDGFINELWMIAFADESIPIKLPPSDVLFAEWKPRTANAIAYSTGEAGQGSAPWKSLNNLWLMQIDRQTGSARSIEEIIPERAGGAYGWWGTAYRWSSQGDQLGWVHAEAMGVVDIEAKHMLKLQEYAAFDTSQAWVWLPSLSWSHDNQLIASIAHGAPLGNEPAEASPVFDLAVSQVDGDFSAIVKRAVGMWAAPTFSPNVAARGAEFAEGFLAWLQAREPYNSINAEYDLILADRDGSNQRLIFPPAGQPGIRSSTIGLTAPEIVWSPDARFIAVIYQGNLWLVEVDSGRDHQVTFDGGASNPVWTR